MHILPQKPSKSSTFAKSGGFDTFKGENMDLMIQIRFFNPTYVFNGSKYIGYDVKIVTFRKFFFRPLFNFSQL